MREKGSGQSSEEQTMIRLTDDIVERIRRHAEQTYPEECCGAMMGRSAGRNQSVEILVPIDNTQAENRERRFLITPRQYQQCEQAARSMNMELLGFYHSHPDHPAVPSTFDREHALPWFTYVIVSVQAGRSRGVTGWMLSEDRTIFTERPLAILSTPLQTNPGISF